MSAPCHSVVRLTSKKKEQMMDEDRAHHSATHSDHELLWCPVLITPEKGADS
jgi:hypothetical protein